MSSRFYAPVIKLTPVHNKGLSLIELMIAMAIGLLLVVMIGTAYLGAVTSFRSQNAISSLQENARYAFAFLGADIRMAGFNGGPTDSTVTQPVGWSGLKDLQNFPLIGYQEGVSTFPSFSVSRPRLRGDALTVVHADNEENYALDSSVTPNPSTTTFTLASWPTTVPVVGGAFVGADYTHSAAFTVSAVNSGARTVTTTDGLGTFGGAPGARRLFPLSGATYYIASNPANEPALYRTKLRADGSSSAEELVEGVQDMQITYGVDYSAAPAATNISAASWASNVITFTSTAHGLVTNDWVTISGVTPSTYNGVYRVTSAAADTFTVNKTTSPGGYTSGGTAKKAVDRSVDAYWTADQVNTGTDGTNTIPGVASADNYWAHVLSVRVTLILTTKQAEKVSTSGGLLTKTFTTTFAVRNRL